MTAHDPIQRSVESIVLLYLAVAAGLILWVLSVDWFLELPMYQVSDVTPVALIPTALVGGVLVGVSIDDAGDAAGGAAAGVACGFLLAVVLHIAVLSVLHGVGAAGISDLITSVWKEVAVQWLQAVLVGTIGALAPSRL